MNARPALPDGFIDAEQMDPAEQIVGPFYKHHIDCKTLFWPEPRHTNLSGVVHGGILMTFADFTLCSSAMRDTDDSGCFTINMSFNFVDNTEPGQWITGLGSVTRQTRNMVFVTGSLLADDVTLVTFNGVGKRIRKNT